MGTYQLKGNNDIELSLGGATMMSCPNLDLEAQFFDALKQTKSYRTDGHILLLNNVENEVIAKLEVMGK